MGAHLALCPPTRISSVWHLAAAFVKFESTVAMRYHYHVEGEPLSHVKWQIKWLMLLFTIPVVSSSSSSLNFSSAVLIFSFNAISNLNECCYGTQFSEQFFFPISLSKKTFKF